MTMAMANQISAQEYEVPSINGVNGRDLNHRSLGNGAGLIEMAVIVPTEVSSCHGNTPDTVLATPFSI